MKALPLLIAVPLFALGGCLATVPSPDAAPGPVNTLAPAPAVELPPASIMGSEEESAMLDNFTVFITAVDGVAVAAGREGWNTAVALKAGKRNLTVAFNRGVFAAQARLELTAVSEAVYQVRFATDAQFLGHNTYCDFWIVNSATGEPVTGRVRAPLTRAEPALAK